MFKILLWIISILTATLVTAATFTAVIAPRANALHTGINLTPDLTPGNAIPDNVICDRSGIYGAMDLYCYRHQADGTTVNVSLDRNRQVITRASFNVHGETLGGLILNWGTPQGYIKYGRNIEVYWQNRSVFLFEPLAPDSNVYYVSFQPQPTGMPRPWMGFQSVSKRP